MPTLNKTVDSSLTKKELNSLKRWAGHNHSRWIASNKRATLSDLLGYLRVVEEELAAHDPDTVLAEIIDELDVAADYLGDFQNLDEPVTGDELATVGYRLADLGQDIGDAEELIAA